MHAYGGNETERENRHKSGGRIMVHNDPRKKMENQQKFNNALTLWDITGQKCLSYTLVHYIKSKLNDKFRIIYVIDNILTCFFLFPSPEG